MVETVADLWAMERGGAFRGRYHVLGGVLSALDAVGPETLRIAELVGASRDEGTAEVILALNATIDGQTTAHYIADQLAPLGVARHHARQGRADRGRARLPRRRHHRRGAPGAPPALSGYGLAQYLLRATSAREAPLIVFRAKAGLFSVKDVLKALPIGKLPDIVCRLG